MGTRLWVIRFAQVFAIALFVIVASHLLRGRPLDYAIEQGLLWSAITASVFTAARIRQSRRMQHCTICRDTPEMRSAVKDAA